MEKFINQSPLFLVIICLIIGFAFLMKGADYFVEGSSSVAKRLKVPSIIIGLTIVAMGTSLPETAVSVTASIANNNARCKKRNKYKRYSIISCMCDITSHIWLSCIRR